MRRLLPLLLAALAACQVEVEGAPCRAGHAEDCPSGQGCGDDLRCSASGCKCRDGLVCGATSGAPSCVCPPNPGPEFAADPGGGAIVDAAPPTGVTSPISCRFGRLGDALVAAAAHAAAHPETGAVARAYGEPPVTFGLAETGETFPLGIEPGVALSTAAGAPDPVSWIIRADTASPADVVTLHDGARVEGFTLRSVSATGDVVRLSCAARNKATLSHVAVDAGGVAARGVSVVGPCDVEATELAISGAAGTGLFVDVELTSDTEPATGMTISGGSITDNGASGAEVRAGRLGLIGEATRLLPIARNGGFGVLARARDESAVAIALEIQLANVYSNAETGVVISNLKPGSSAAIRSTEMHENLASTTSSETVAGRRAGGMSINGTPAVPLTLEGNRFYSNRYDQLGIVSDKIWNLSGTNCNAGANVFACNDDVGGGKLVHAFSAKQTVDVAQWSVVPPTDLVFNIFFGVCSDQSRVPICPPIPPAP